MKFFSLNKSELSKRVFDKLSQNDDNNLIIDRFSDNEFQPIFRESVRDEDIYLMADGSSSESIMQLCLTIDAANRAGSKSITVIYPYCPYSRQDKLKNHIRSSISAKTIADMLQCVGMDKLITIELHNLSIQGFYKELIHLNGNKIFTKYVKSLNLDNICICAPDQGAIERNIDFGKAFKNSSFATINKTRIRPNEIHKMSLIGEVTGKNVIIIDDLIDTAGTLQKASILLKDKGASEIYAISTHGVLSGNCLENIYNSALNQLIISDTVYGTLEKVIEYNRLYTTTNNLGILPKINIISCDEFLTESIIRLNNHRSITELNMIN